MRCPPRISPLIRGIEGVGRLKGGFLIADEYFSQRISEHSRSIATEKT